MLVFIKMLTRSLKICVRYLKNKTQVIKFNMNQGELQEGTRCLLETEE